MALLRGSPSAGLLTPTLLLVPRLSWLVHVCVPEVLVFSVGYDHGRSKLMWNISVWLWGADASRGNQSLWCPQGTGTLHCQWPPRQEPRARGLKVQSPAEGPTSVTAPG